MRTASEHDRTQVGVQLRTLAPMSALVSRDKDYLCSSYHTGFNVGHFLKTIMHVAVLVHCKVQ